MSKNEEHATHRALINAGVELAKEFGMYNFTVEQLLSKSGISKGSLYHHFEDFPDLVEWVQVELYSQYIAADLVAIEQALATADNFEKFRNLISLITRASLNPERAASRFQRTRILSATQDRERFRSRIGRQQKLMREGLERAIQLGQDRGWANKDLPAAAMALFVQSYPFGLLLNDVSEDPVSAEDWVTVIDAVLENVILAK